MTPKATSPALQKNPANANKMKTLESADGGRPAGFPRGGSGKSGGVGHGPVRAGIPDAAAQPNENRQRRRRRNDEHRKGCRQ